MRLSKFLKKHKVYKQFKNNFDIAHSGYKEGDSGYSVSIGGAFLWTNTPEGFTFWNEINELWSSTKKKKYDLIVENNKLKKIKGY